MGQGIPLAKFAAALDEAGYLPMHELEGEGPKYAAGYDKLRDLTMLRPGGHLLVASTCPLDGLAQVRRLDFALAAATELVATLKPGTHYRKQTAWWAIPTSWYGDKAGTYQRQYLPEGIDLNKPMNGTASCTEAPVAAGFGLIGRADEPSTVGDVVAVEKLTVGDEVLAQGDKAKTKTQVALFFDLGDALIAGDVPWKADLLVADASVRPETGIYWAFFEALFDTTSVLTVSVQGALPGTSRISRAVEVLALPDAITEVFE